MTTTMIMMMLGLMHMEKHIGPVAHFVDVGVTRNVKGCQKLQSGWPTHFVDQHICWCGWCSVTVQFVVSGLPIDTICWSGDVFRINILRKRPILLVHLINIHNGYAFRNNILCLQNQHSVPSESTFCALRINILVWHPSLGRKSVYYNHHRHNHHYLWCLVVVSPLFCALFTGNMTVFAKCLTLAYSFMKNSPFWMMMIIIITLVIVMMLIICISSTFSLKVHLKSHHNHYNQDYPHHNMYGGGEGL